MPSSSSVALSPETTGRLDNWKELLLDLFFVIFLIKLGNLFVHCALDDNGYLFAVSHFLGIYMAKFELDQYLNKYCHRDLIHYSFMIFYSFGLFISILNVNDTSEWSESDSFENVSCPAYRLYEYGFSAGWLITRGLLLIMYVAIAYLVKPQGLYSLITKAPILVSSITLMAFSFWWSDGDVDFAQNHSYIVLAASLVEYFGWPLYLLSLIFVRFALWQIGVVGTYVQKYVGTKAYIPVNINHQSARTSSFILSVLGATFYQIMTTRTRPSRDYYLAVCLSFSLVLSLSLIYFDVIPPKNSTHALGKSRLSGMVWLMLHPVYGFCIFVVGVCLQKLLDSFEESESNFHPIQRFTLGIFVAAALTCVLLIRWTHKVFWSAGGKLTIFIRCLIIIAIVIVALHSLHQQNQSASAVLGTLVALCISHLVIDLFKYRQLERVLLRTYEPVDRSNQHQTPQLLSNEPKNDIIYVPVERRENWANILGDIRNYQKKPSQTSMTSSLTQESKMDGVPVINLQRRYNTSTKLISSQSSKMDSRDDNQNKISVPKMQSASVLISPQRRASLDSGKVVRVIRSRPNSGDKRRLSYHENHTSIPLDHQPIDQTINVRRNLSAVQLGQLLADPPGGRASHVQDENGLVRERIIIRRKKNPLSNPKENEQHVGQSNQVPQNTSADVSEMPRICERGESVESIAIDPRTQNIWRDGDEKSQINDTDDVIILPSRPGISSR